MFILILYLLRIVFPSLESIGDFSFNPKVSIGEASYHRDKHVKLIINSIFLSNVSRVLSTNRYNVDLSSCKFY
jgi:hypothetical protein